MRRFLSPSFLLLTLTGVFCVAVSLIAHFLTAQVPETSSTLPKPDESPLFVERYSELHPGERAAIQVYEQCNKSVVNIDTKTIRTSLLFGHFDEPGAGSGIVLDKEGHILTNYHVIANVDVANVTLYNGESYDAWLVGFDPITDLAVIVIQAPKEVLFPITFGDSSKLLVGQQIFAIGNPFGLERTLTGGLISSLNRSLPGRVDGRSIRGAIQTDAAINPGNSGGALLDTQGRLIGINTAIASKSGGSHGVGFAIPSKTILRIAPQLISTGKVIRGETGIDVVRAVSHDFPHGKMHGLLILQLTSGGAAEKAGLRGPTIVRMRGGIPRRDESTSDVILAVEGNPIKKVDDFTAVIDELRPNDKVTLDVFREGKIIKVTLTLE